MPRCGIADIFVGVAARLRVLALSSQQVRTSDAFGQIPVSAAGQE
jgi:hypothetical protein